MLRSVHVQHANIGNHIWDVLIHGENPCTVMVVENVLNFVPVDNGFKIRNNQKQVSNVDQK
jgi:hypothetical protein